MLTEHFDVVIGVDIHKHTYAAAVVASTGAVLEHLTVCGPEGLSRTPHARVTVPSVALRDRGSGGVGAALTAVLLVGGNRS
jgi:hypothetical protein